MFVTEMSVSCRRQIHQETLGKLSRVETTEDYNRFLLDVRQQFPKGVFNARMQANLSRMGGTLALTQTLKDLFLNTGRVPYRARRR
jgi:hypothetical protein